MSRSKEAHWETDPQCWATAAHQRQDGQSCTRTLLQPKIKHDKLRKCHSALRKKTGFGPQAEEGEEESCLNMWKKKEILLKAVVTISASFLPPEPEGTNNNSKMLLEDIWTSLPWSIMQTYFRHWYKVTAIQRPEEIWDMEAHRWLCMASGPALSQELICQTIPKCYLWISEFKTNLWKLPICTGASCFHKTPQCLQNSTPFLYHIFKAHRPSLCDGAADSWRYRERCLQWQGYSAPDEWLEQGAATLNEREYKTGCLCCRDPF